MLIIDFGNTHANIYDDKKISKIKTVDFKNPNRKFYYINVNPLLEKKLHSLPNAINLENKINLKTNYQGLGVDRKALCSFINDGIIVDAGSAITIDIMDSSFHKGGFIMQGINSYYKSYENISSTLKQERVFDFSHDIGKIPQTTKQAVEFSIFKSIVLTIKDISKDKKIYFCGGDGLELSYYFENSIFNKDLMFDALKKIIKDNKC